ncbi:hypothetical protein [Streptomyces sp. NPDC056690]
MTNQLQEHGDLFRLPGHERVPPKTVQDAASSRSRITAFSVAAP